MSQKVMTPADSNDLEPSLLQNGDELSAAQPAHPGHASTVTRASATNSDLGLSPSASRHRAIASRIRSMRTSIVLACVWQPRSSGTLPTSHPSSSRSTTTLNSCGLPRLRGCRVVGRRFLFPDPVLIVVEPPFYRGTRVRFAGDAAARGWRRGTVRDPRDHIAHKRREDTPREGHVLSYVYGGGTPCRAK